VRIVFLGTPAAAVPSLEALLDAGHEVPLVVTQPDRPAGRSRSPVPPPVKVAALAAGLTVAQPRRVRTPDFRRMLAERRPEFLAVVAYGRILTPAVLGVPSIAPVNLHFSLLPRYRGAAPVQWTLARGEARAGVTTMVMSEGLDEGDILLQEPVPIVAGEHAPELQARLAALGAGLLVRTLDGLAGGSIVPRPQDHARATLAPILSKEDGHLSPGMSAQEIEGRVRGFDPWPGAWLWRNGRRLRIVRAQADPVLDPGAVPGAVVHEDGGLLLICGGGTRLRLDEVQPEGKRAMSVRDAINGRQLEAGDRLDGPPPAD